MKRAATAVDSSVAPDGKRPALGASSARAPHASDRNGVEEMESASTSLEGSGSSVDRALTQDGSQVMSASGDDAFRSDSPTLPIPDADAAAGPQPKNALVDGWEMVPSPVRSGIRRSRPISEETWLVINSDPE